MTIRPPSSEAPPLGPPVAAGFFERPVAVVAPELIGCTLLVDGVGGRLVEVEAYDRDDPASHSYRGRTPRNAAMFGPAGHAYVYRSYGVHWLLNLVCGPPGNGAAVLVRALVPEHGRDAIAARRPGVPERDWCRGPGRLALALAIEPAHDAAPLDRHPFRLLARTHEPDVHATPRVGISRGRERRWRFVESASRWVSGPPAASRRATA